MSENNDEEKEKVFNKVPQWLKEERYWTKDISGVDKKTGSKKFDIYVKNDSQDKKGIHVFFSPLRRDAVVVVVNLTLEKNDTKAFFALTDELQNKFQKK